MKKQTKNNLLFKIVSNVLLLWAVSLITYATIVVFESDWSTINGAMAAIYGSAVSVLSVVTGYIQKRLGDYIRDEDRSRFTK